MNIRETVSRALKMVRKPPDIDRIRASITDVERRLEQERAALATVEQDIAREAIEGASDDVTLARQSARLGEARARVAGLVDRLDMLNGIARASSDAAAEGARNAKIAKAERLCREREAVANEIDAAVAQLATLFERFVALNGQVMGALPNAPSDLPAMFRVDGLCNLIGAKLLAATGGRWAPRVAVVSVHNAATMPPLAARAAEERSRLLDQYARPNPPEAA